ncbi:MULTISPECIES: 3-oxoacyl-ACP synthase III family protein [Chryseobacterium]|uniref:3-oxoacyl-[acyl-carrier-protein] synthase-3 n=1 Tax=Chryseobacterium camelliae TaxID=1265445 RepID=A0ABU0THR9_9FLAO|nr:MULTISPECIES: ketoacyl-ACP synthase III [Chryseobacterium]MDT3409535.1 3-oxoacyl-[acyl-carrier-protein] synthase-3 [Pseudacidovorax intermedius]MDQ1096602.1 3-oxoacyl-[acyl-carrier-protein] synthase-3 [Chryseobacterium camelliae]MDQ1100543.1 3-oxoacyl-[acyl-carrier-protein] synthase-3 [Chryseobacterium sp. SORGH_AS_1048]MDR6087884.1 3-oxoacyl-[acyl-carrier-protein] synthase-3 [Chryseobacterium sp. SORGH_AS_0909]MDR6132259.1 3-oxoacyl-[acyl-carrier-protein] synthase-3 [Chryseobacterium sp. S
MTSKITGVGKYIPEETITNLFFNQHVFLSEDGAQLKDDNASITEKLKKITGIEERRYAGSHQVTSDLGLIAAQDAIEDSGIDPETLDYIIFAHNFGDVRFGTIQSDAVPSLAARVKHMLKIKNNFCVAYDMLFGCPGWIEGMIQAHAFIKSGMAKRCLVIGAETLSRVVDVHDRDSMIYADGAGAVILERNDKDDSGIKSHLSASYTLNEKDFLHFGKSYNTESCPDTKYIKMDGRKIYEFALLRVPEAMKKCFDNSGYDISRLNKIIIHQANEKMDEAIVNRFYQLYEMPVPDNIMPMVIHKLGNSSVATIPTLLSMILKGELDTHDIREGDVVLFASVGAGMNINAVVYQF